MSVIKTRYSIFGKAIFYFGFVFFNRDASALTNFVTYSQRLKDKLINFSKFTAVAESQDKNQEKAQGTVQP